MMTGTAMMNRTIMMIGISILTITPFAGCRKPYTNPAIASPASYLVVEGIINMGTDTTFIKLSKTVPLSSKSALNPVPGATVTIENNQNGSYPLAEKAKGYYFLAGLGLDNTLQYRLRIKTADGEYLSDFVPVVNAPGVDTVSYTVQGNGIQLNVSSHDPKNNTHYYRWDYQETWVVHSKYYSFYKSNGDTVIERNFPAEQVYQCWQSDTSSNILLATSANLSSDVVSNVPVTFVPSTSPKVDGAQSILDTQSAPSSSAYSILVKQYALTAGAYRFWVNLKKNTEQLGGIFDPQPSDINGNIHSLTKPSEPVIGYISAGAVTSKRIFIKNGQIPTAWLPNLSNSTCKLDSVYLYAKPAGSAVFVNEEDDYFNYNKNVKYFSLLIPVAGLFNKLTGATIGHTGSTPECVDCTLKGTNKQPIFWK